MEHEHKIVLKKKTEEASQRKLETMFKKTTSTGSGSRPKKNDKKFELIRQLSLLCARSLISFNFVSKQPFEDFCKFYNVIDTMDKMPMSSSISNAGLDDIYTLMKTNLLNIISELPKGIAMTLDCWTDNYKR